MFVVITTIFIFDVAFYYFYPKSDCLTVCGHLFVTFQISNSTKKKKDEFNAENLDFNRKILHTAWHPKDHIIAVAATNNLYIFDGGDAPASSLGAGR